MAAQPSCHVIVPSESELAVEQEVKCSIEGCGKSFKSSACYRMHITRHHKGVCLTSVAPSNGTNLYYCPVSGCNRGTQGKPFPRMGQLKQHYNTVHSAKTFVCPQCGRGFGLKDAHGRHVKECGRVFQCTSCEAEFKSSNALYQHQKRTGHQYQRKKAPPTTTPTTPSPVIIAPIVVKNVLPIPKVSKSESSSQTITPSAPSTDVGTSLNDLPGFDLATQTDISCVMADNFLLGSSHFLYSQDDSLPDSIIHQSVQTNPISLCEFGTQTAPSSCDWAEALPRPPLQVEPHDLSLAEFLSSVDFGTQTLDIDYQSTFDSSQSQLVTKDQESQT